MNDWVLRTRRDPTLRREADVMGMTVCVALLAALTATGGDHDPHTKLDVLVVVWGTTLGIALTHWFALALSIRLVRDPGYSYGAGTLLGASLILVGLVAITATLAVLVLGTDYDRLGARIAAAASLAVLVALESREGGASVRHATLLATTALLVGLAIATVKWLVS